MPKILVVEDDNEINNLIKDYFELKKFDIQQAFSGTEALLWANQEQFDAVILDLMLPGKNGEEVLQLIKEKQDVPVLIISAKDRDQSTIETLQLGADDFLAKPFNIEELALRVRKNILMYQRIHEAAPQTGSLHFGDIELSESQRRVTIQGATVSLTTKEFDILTLFMKSPNQVFTKEKILEIVWQDEVEIDTNAVSVHISNLRKKLGSAAVIKTIWGIGFKIEKPL